MKQNLILTKVKIVNYYSNFINTDIDPYIMCINNVTAYIRNLPIQQVDQSLLRRCCSLWTYSIAMKCFYFNMGAISILHNNQTATNTAQNIVSIKQSILDLFHMS